MQKILFSCLYGSQLYGTSTPESDRDMKYIVLPELDSLLLGKSIKNTRPVINDIDCENVPLQVFAKDFMEGQTYALELAASVECVDGEQAIYDGRFPLFCTELHDKFLTANIKSMVGYAVNQAQVYSDKGDRLNAAQAARDLFKRFPKLHRIVDHQAEFEELAVEIEKDYPKYFSITDYAIDSAGQNMRPCIKLLEKILPYSSAFETNLDIVNVQVAKFGTRAKDAAQSTADWKAVSHALRIVNEGIDLLSGKKLKYPYTSDYAEYLKSIRRGEHPIEKIREQILVGVDTLKTLSLESKLPALTVELRKEYEEWILPWLKKFYGLEK